MLFVIITDGAENSSNEYSRDKIKSMINSAEKEDKWDFIFLGANIDAIAEAGNIGIKSDNATGYVQDKAGYGKAYDAVNKAVEVKQQSKPITSEWKSEVEKITTNAVKITKHLLFIHQNSTVRRTVLFSHPAVLFPRNSAYHEHQMTEVQPDKYANLTILMLTPRRRKPIIPRIMRIIWQHTTRPVLINWSCVMMS